MRTHHLATDRPRDDRRAAHEGSSLAAIHPAEDKHRRSAAPGVLFAVAAVSVTAPRLALAFLAADGVGVPTSWRIDLLAVASIASAVVLTGGTAYLAQAIAVTRSRRGVLVALWTAALACSGALIAPVIVATLRAQPHSAVLGVHRHWAWSICAVLAIDLVAWVLRPAPLHADHRPSPSDPPPRARGSQQTSAPKLHNPGNRVSSQRCFALARKTAGRGLTPPVPRGSLRSRNQRIGRLRTRPSARFRGATRRRPSPASRQSITNGAAD